ncbi:MAG TPA: SgcJ/EcaC family oxidoreductase [Pyrinomonadaceae bacterium]|nr:SgcJ/EcaC family oxidoreductase [Pyrinomonadaceae bacterium]
MQVAERKETTGNEAEIRAIIEDWGEGLKNRDAERCISHYADDVLQFNLAPPLEYRGKNVVAKQLTDWLNTFSGPIDFETTDLKIAAGSDTAFAHCFNHIKGTGTNGQQSDIWVRVTIGFQRRDGKWLVTHEHISVPFYMDGSFRAAVDLKP